MRILFIIAHSENKLKIFAKYKKLSYKTAYDLIQLQTQKSCYPNFLKNMIT